MPSATFRLLIDQLCQLSKLPDAKALYERTALNIDGVDISLVEREGAVSEIIIHCDLGALPTRRRDEVLCRLLEINFSLFTGSASPACTVNPQTGRVTLAAVAPLAGLGAVGLLELLGQLADMAHAWRQGYFLETTPARGNLQRGVAR